MFDFSEGFPKRIKLYREVKWWLIGVPASTAGLWLTMWLLAAFQATPLSATGAVLVFSLVMAGSMTATGAVVLVVGTCVSLEERYHLAAKGNRFAEWFANDDK